MTVPAPTPNVPPPGQPYRRVHGPAARRRSHPSTYPLVVALGIALFMPVIGLSVMSDSADAAQALREGEHGRFTATHREPNGKAGRWHWEGTFISDDGSTKRAGISLGLNDSADDLDPPPVYPDTYLNDDGNVAYPADYDVSSRRNLGIAVIAGGLVVAAGAGIALIVSARRRPSD